MALLQEKYPALHAELLPNIEAKLIGDIQDGDYGHQSLEAAKHSFTLLIDHSDPNRQKQNIITILEGTRERNKRSHSGNRAEFLKYIRDILQQRNIQINCEDYLS